MGEVLHINLEALNEAFVQDLKKQYGAAEVNISIQTTPENWLTEARFWQIIGQLDWSESDDREAILAPAVNALANLPIGNIHQFQDILSEKLWLLDTYAQAKPFMDKHPKGRLSVDDFLYVRCAVVAEGEVYFKKALAKPASIPQDLTFEPLLHLASLAYQKKTGLQFVHIPAYDFETYGNEQGWS